MKDVMALLEDEWGGAPALEARATAGSRLLRRLNHGILRNKD